MKFALLIFFLFTFTFVVAAQEFVTVTSYDAIVRGIPDADGIVVTTVKQGDRLELIIQKGEWILVQTPEYVGWVHKSSFEPDSEPISDVRINRQPFRDLAPLALETFDFNPNDPADTINIKPFKVVLNGFLKRKMITDEYGDRNLVIGFDEIRSRFLRIDPAESGDPSTVELAKRAIQALGDSGFFGYVHNFGFVECTITLSLTDGKVVFIFESLQPTEAKAKSAALGLNGFLSIARITIKPGTNERTLLEGALKTPVTVTDNTVTLKVEIPVETAEEMIKGSLLKAHQRATDERAIN